MSMGVWDKDPSEWKAYDLHMYAGDANIPAALYKRLQASGVYDRAYKPMILAAFRNRPSLIDTVKTDEEHAELEQWAVRDAFNHLVNYGYSMLGGGSQSAINRHMAESRLGWLNMGWQTNLYYQAPFANSMWSWQDREFRLHNRSDVRQAAAESIVNAVSRINSSDKLRVPGTAAYLTVPDDILDVAQHGAEARPVAKPKPKPTEEEYGIDPETPVRQQFRGRWTDTIWGHAMHTFGDSSNIEKRLEVARLLATGAAYTEELPNGTLKLKLTTVEARPVSAPRGAVVDSRGAVVENGTSMDWQTSFREMLERRAHADYMASGRTPKERKRWTPPEWLTDAQDALRRNDEHAAKRGMLDAYIPSERERKRK